MTLWIAAGALMAGTLTALVWPLLGRHRADTENPELMVYADQLEETERDVERGLLSEQDAGNLRVEIIRRMIASVRAGRPLTRAQMGQLPCTSTAH